MGLSCPAPFISITGCDNLTSYFFLSILMETDFARADVFFGQSLVVLVRAEIGSQLLKNTATLGLEAKSCR
jgi:hypothetical protein